MATLSLETFMCPVKSSFPLSLRPMLAFRYRHRRDHLAGQRRPRLGWVGDHCSATKNSNQIRTWSTWMTRVFLLKLLHRTFFGRQGYEVRKLSANFQIGVRSALHDRGGLGSGLPQRPAARQEPTGKGASIDLYLANCN